MNIICLKFREVRKHFYFLFFPKLQLKYKQNRIYNNVLCYNIEVSLEESKTRELTGKELVEDRVGLIIKSPVTFSEIISDFLFRKLLLC